MCMRSVYEYATSSLTKELSVEVPLNLENILRRSRSDFIAAQPCHRGADGK
jgi:hypothetical protein